MVEGWVKKERKERDWKKDEKGEGIKMERLKKVKKWWGEVLRSGENGEEEFSSNNEKENEEGKKEGWDEGEKVNKRDGDEVEVEIKRRIGGNNREKIGREEVLRKVCKDNLNEECDEKRIKNRKEWEKIEEEELKGVKEKENKGWWWK